VPKGSKLAQEAQAMAKVMPGKTGGRSRKNSKVTAYVEKKPKGATSKAAGAAEVGGKGKSMYHLLSSLAPDQNEENNKEESLSEDEDAAKLVNRRTSINIDNVIGFDFEHYNKMKPSQQIKLKIKNLVMEFVQGRDREHASSEFIDLCATNDIKPYMVAGYILNNAFSQT